MIQLYIPGNNNFTKNGDTVLLPISCIISAQINGTWQMELTHPIDEEGRWKLIEVGAVIKAPSFNGDQLFRIRQTAKQDSGVTATAEPIFLDAVGDCFLLDVRPTNRTGQQALNDILAPNNKYSGTSNITTKSTAYYVRKNALEAIASDDDNSFLNRWGGEILFNNYQIVINDRIGGDYGVSLLYGKNIPVDGLKETINMDGVTTRIIPKAYNGYTLPGNRPWVDSPIVNSYPTVMTSVVEFPEVRLASDVEGDTAGLIICNTMEELYAALRQKATEQFTNGIDKPSVSIEANMVMLQNTVEYKDYAELEKVSLGDTIHCKHNRLNIVTDARVVALQYDCTRKAVESVTIGQAQASFMDKVASTVNRTEKAITKAGGVKAEQVEGFINGAMAQLRVQNTVAKRQDVMAILFEDLDPESPTYGALGIGTQGWQISQERTADDEGWVWSTAATAKGIIADYIVAGILSDRRGLNYWNMDTGEFSLSANATVGGSTVQQIAQTAAGAAVDAQTQQQIFNKLTNNGASQGIYLSNGQLYINGTYIQSGVIDAGLITTGTLRAIDISGVNITGSAITGNTISGGTITGTGINNGNGTFQVSSSGALKATSAEITGAIKSGSTITGSAISGGTITGGAISGGTVTGTAINNGNGTFTVSASGALKATSAEITGAIKSGSTITGSAISGGTITGGAISGGTISGTTITGTTINGNTITGGSISGTTITSSGKIAEDSNLSDTIRMAYGYYLAEREVSANVKNIATLNSDYLTIRQETGGNITGYATLELDTVAVVGTDYQWRASAKSGLTSLVGTDYEWNADAKLGVTSLAGTDYQWRADAELGSTELVGTDYRWSANAELGATSLVGTDYQWSADAKLGSMFMQRKVNGSWVTVARINISDTGGLDIIAPDNSKQMTYSLSTGNLTVKSGSGSARITPTNISLLDSNGSVLWSAI